MSAPSPDHPVRTRRWVSIVDPDGDEWLFDLTFLTSDWTCIFGRGCPGILAEPAPELGHGCCSHGAHFADEDDVQRVALATARLTDDTWQNRRESKRRGGPFKQQQGATVSRLFEGACIFLNRPGFPGGAGCALHAAALAAGERPLDWKPEVCWQLPLRLSYHTDENDRTTHTLRAWDREDWGGGGDEFHWWCTDHRDAPLAFVGDRPVYVELRDEIVALIGEDRYRQLVEQVEADRAVIVAPPTLKNRG
jgi:hypothetical protein